MVDHYYFLNFSSLKSIIISSVSCYHLLKLSIFLHSHSHLSRFPPCPPPFFCPPTKSHLLSSELDCFVASVSRSVRPVIWQDLDLGVQNTWSDSDLGVHYSTVLMLVDFRYLHYQAHYYQDRHIKGTVDINQRVPQSLQWHGRFTMGL